MSKPKQQAIVTPAGEAKYANISKPKLNFKKTGDEYSVDLRFKPAEIADFKAKLIALAEAAKKEAIDNAKNGREAKLIAAYELFVPIKDELDKDSGDETGFVILQAKNGASYTDKKTGNVIERSLPVFDAAGKPVKGLNIGRGSTLKISVVPAPFVNPSNKKAGVSLWLKAVQVINLVEYGGGSADSFGFGEEEGYVMDEDKALKDAGDAAGNEDF